MEEEQKLENPQLTETQAPAQAENQVKESETQEKPITLADLERIKQEAKSEALSEYKGIQRVLDKVQKENKRLKEQIGKTQPTSDLSGMYDVMEAQARANGDSEMLAKIAQYKENDKRKQQQFAYEQQLARQQELVAFEREKLESRIQESGLDPDDPKFDRVWAEFKLAASTDGDFTEASRLLDKRIGKESKVESKPVAKTETPSKPETEAEIEERVRRKIYEELKLTKPEGVSPSGTRGRIYSAKEIEKMPLAEYNKMRDDIRAAWAEGRIKE